MLLVLASRHEGREGRWGRILVGAGGVGGSLKADCFFKPNEIGEPENRHERLGGERERLGMSLRPSAVCEMMMGVLKTAEMSREGTLMPVTGRIGSTVQEG